MGQQEMSDLYENDVNFRSFADKYCIKHDVMLEEAYERIVVKEVAKLYTEEKEKEGSMCKSTYTPVGEYK